MTRAKAWLSAVAAVFVAAGGALTWQQSIERAREDLHMTCEDLGKVSALADQRRPVWWFVALADGFSPPAAFQVAGEPRAIGVVEGSGASGSLVVEDDSCGGAGYRYEYTRATSVAGYRVYLMRGDRYFARSWQLGADLTTQVKWLGSWSDTVDKCLANFTPAQCRNALGQVSQCWRLGDGTQCRAYDAGTQQGLHYGPGVGGVLSDGSPATCVLDVDARPIPCDDNGEGPGYVERAIAASLELDDE